MRTESREISSPSLTSHGKRRWIIEVFITDVVVASKINAAFNPTTLFAPMVERQGSTQTMETYSHMLPGVGDVAATALEEPLADLLLPYCCQDPSSMIVGSSLFIGFAEGCKCRIYMRLSLLRVAECCTVLPSRWCQHQPRIHLLLTRPG